MIQTPDFFSESGQKAKEKLRASLKRFKVGIKLESQKENLSFVTNNSSRAMLYADNDEREIKETKEEFNSREADLQLSMNFTD